MSNADTGQLLLLLAALFLLTYALGSVLSRFRIPVILAAMLVAMAAHYTPVGAIVTHGSAGHAFGFLAQLGVMFLLFYIGLQIDLKEMRDLSKDIVWATFLNTSIPFILGVIVILSMGYGWVIALVIGISRMPTAEAVIVPILDEFKLLRTRIGMFIVGAGVLDDIIEVVLVAIVSIWIGEKSSTALGAEREIVHVLLGIIIFVLVAYFCYHWLLPMLSKWLPRHTRNLMLLAVLVMMSFSGFSEIAGLGMVVGAIVAGILLRPVVNQSGRVGKSFESAIHATSYGFLGPIFFFWVGLSLDLGGMLKEPLLVILIFLAAFLGKLIGIFIMVPMRKLNSKEAIAIGIGLNARLTTEIIVDKLLFDAKIIDIHLFTALVASSSLSTFIVPILFTTILGKWDKTLSKKLPDSKQIDI
jgi:Ca2+-transporting ATPase